MNRQVPVLPELGEVGRVPPVLVEVAVGELEQLAGDVEHGVEDEVAAQQPQDVVWHRQPEKKQVAEHLKKGRIGGHLINLSVARGRLVWLKGTKEFTRLGMIHCCVSAMIMCVRKITCVSQLYSFEMKSRPHLTNSSCQEPFPDSAGSREVELIAESGGEEEVVDVGQSEIVGIHHDVLLLLRLLVTTGASPIL